ncbi:MAG: heme exporter protein CcmB [Cyclobacteriaceae bacterium]|nr:heme exporter protein CcmB [Cyclobacteriaceae bacterium]
MKEVFFLVRKEILLEWRQRYAISGILLYLTSSVFLVYMALGTAGGADLSQAPDTWIAIFWIVMLFTAVNAIARSFIQESRGLRLYHYIIASPVSIILSRVIYNTLLMLLLVFAGIPVFMLVLGNPIQNVPLFALTAFLGALGFSAAFTMISAIASHAGNAGTLMAILGFPVILPLLLLLIKVSQATVLSAVPEQTNGQIFNLLAIIMISLSTSILLFPYLWRAN